ncbi:MAG: polyprenyl synthetase family protein [Candidatus Schekmanbacteria bacterium]|nr:polyprenyl synthetase family protein [Candidatus Schekmanbacteria bacterium]
MQKSDIPKLIQTELMLVETELQKRLDLDNELISQVSRHICNSGGKRMRPMLLLLASRLCNYEGQKSILYACVMEMIHVATLLHDDVIDGSVSRRGSISANAKWGNNVSVLAGDYLYALSNVMLVEAEILQIVGIVSETIMHLTDGEIRETIKKKDVQITEADYMNIIFKKTAALFCACCKVGAILGEVGTEREKALYGYGLNLGLAFQMMDDVLDYTADEKRLGKPVGNDLKEGNLTIPIIRLMQKAKPVELEQIGQIMKNPQGTKEELSCMMNLFEQYRIFPAIVSNACRYVEKAQKCLEGFADSPYKEALWTVADYVVERDH